MMVGRSRALSNPGVDGLRSQVAEIDSGNFAASGRARQAGALFAAALAHSKLRDAPSATRTATRLAALVAGDAGAARQATLLAAEIALQAGEPARAAQQIGAAATGRPELMLASQAMLRSGRASEAAQRLQTWVALHPKDAPAWQLLAAAHAAQGQQLRSIRAEAEVRVAQLDYQAAMDRFRAAQDLARKGGADHFEASIIDSRARQVESLLREQALER
jgi:predicted Zn-dependent protease